MASQSGLWKRKVPVALMCAFGASLVQAQEQIAEVVVTAQRSVSVDSKTPVAMSVLSGAQLEQAAIDNAAGIGARLPNVHLDGASDGLRITIRAVSNADTTAKGDPSAAFMLDGVYLARPQIQNVSLFDLARVEVLRGPQGTLYGRNTTAGVVHVISNAPGTQLEGAASAEVGGHSSRKLGAMLNVPVNDALAVRAAVSLNRHDSYLKNDQGTPYTLGLERDDVSARIAARLAIGRSASLLLRVDASRLNSNDDSTVPVGNFYAAGADGSPVWTAGSTDARLTNSFRPFNAPLAQGYGRGRTAGLGAELNWDLGAASLHYAASHRSFDHDYLANYYYRLAPQFAIGVRQTFDGAYKQDSHELRLATKGGGPWNAQAGLYWFREKSDTDYSFRDLELVVQVPYYVFPQVTESVGKALFGQATYSVSERLRATAGMRYSHDEKERIGTTNFQQAAAFNAATDLRLPNIGELATHKATWRLGLEYDLAPRSMLYATASTGYKAGGFNDGCQAGSVVDGVACPASIAVPASALIYQPETVRSLEAGLKTRFWNKRASLHAAAFYYDYANLQLSGVVVVGGAPRFATTNAGQARVKGIEVEGQVALSAAGRLSYALSVLDAYYAAYTPDGVSSWSRRKLDRSPATTLALGYDHTVRMAGGQLKAGLFSRYSADYVISVPSQLLQYRVPSRTQSEINLGYRPDQSRWSVHAHVKNLENTVRPIAIDSFGMVVPSDPRTWGLRLDYRY